MPAPGPPIEGVTIRDIVEGLLLFDEPMLNSRYHELLFRDPDPVRRTLLQRLPQQVIRSHHHARSAAHDWMARGQPLDRAFILQGERVILESFLTLAEAQLRLVAFMAKSSPTAKTRDSFDRMADIHRDICHDLRHVLKGISTETPIAALRSVQEENAMGDLRGQLEEALRLRARRGVIRRIVLSHTAQRHLRDQGLFRDGETSIMGIPVAIDLGWEAPAFAIEGYDVVPLEEIYDGHQDHARGEATGDEPEHGTAGSPAGDPGSKPS